MLKNTSYEADCWLVYFEKLASERGNKQLNDRCHTTIRKRSPGMATIITFLAQETGRTSQAF